MNNVDIKIKDSKMTGKAKTSIINTETKRIKIVSNGPLRTKSGARGPILRPYRETINNIKKLIFLDNAKVIEVLKSGKEIPLNHNNYALDNEENIVEPVKKTVKPEVAPTKVETKVEEKKVEETKPESDKKETPKVEAPNTKADTKVDAKDEVKKEETAKDVSNKNDKYTDKKNNKK